MNLKNSKKSNRNTINLSQAEIIEINNEELELYARIYTNLQGERKATIYTDRTRKQIRECITIQRFKQRYPILSYIA